jgi:predicted amidophosphoribosyltransferase
MSTNLCPFCGTPNTSQARFCKGCGKQLPSQAAPVSGPMANCPQCNQPLSPGVSAGIVVTIPSSKCLNPRLPFRGRRPCLSPSLHQGSQLLLHLLLDRARMKGQ